MDEPANDNGCWTLKVKTYSRDRLIDLSRVIANSLDTNLLQDPDNIPHIQITGAMAGGKSLMVEAMMKTLLDHHDPDDMKQPDAKREMFIEESPGFATRQYCQAIGRTQGVPVMYGFDRITTIRDSTDLSSHGTEKQLVKIFQNAAAKYQTQPVGAIFVSTGMTSPLGEPWIVIEMAVGPLHSCDEGSAFAWDRSLKIRVLDERLKSSPHFLHYWKHIESFAESGIFPEIALRPIKPLSPWMRIKQHVFGA